MSKEISYADYWAVEVNPSLKKTMTRKGYRRLWERLQSYAGGYDLSCFRTKKHAKAWLDQLPEGLKSRCQVTEVMHVYF